MSNIGGKRWSWLALDQDLGPIETKTRAELKKLGWKPDDDGVGAFHTLAAQAVGMAEILDRTMNAAGTPGLNRELRNTMDAARAAAEKAVPDEVKGILGDDDGASGSAGAPGPHHTVTHLRPVPSGAVTG